MTTQTLGTLAARGPAARERYTAVAVVLHWLIAAMIIANLLSGALMEGWLEHVRRQIVPVHESFGIAVLILSAARLAWRLTNPPPPLNSALAGWEKLAAHTVHIGLYVMMFAMPLTGWAVTSANRRSLTFTVMIFGLVPLPRIEPLARLAQPFKETVHGDFVQSHNIGAWILLAMLVGHVAGALKHQFLDGHAEFSRLWFGKARAGLPS